MTSVDAHAVVQRRFALLLLLVTRVRQPPVTLHQDSGPEVLLRVPPVRGAGGRAASAENALVETVQLLALLLRLQVFLAVGAGARVLEVRLDGLVLLVEEGQVRDDVLDDVGVGKRVDLGFLLGVGGNAA